MNWFENSLIQTFGQTLLHSPWQLSAIAAISYVALLASRRHSANARYTLCLIALLCMMAAPLATFYHLNSVPKFTATTSATDASNFPTLILQASPIPATALIQNLPTQTREPIKPVEAVIPYLVFAYALGAMFCFLRLGIGWVHIHRLQKNASTAPTSVLKLFDSLKTRMAVLRPVRLFISNRVDVPTALGMLRPVILLPASAIVGLSPDHLSALLAHEIAHIRRHDYLVNFLQSLVEVALFYHPAVWWISAQIRQEREHCCDDIAITLCENPAQFAHALTTMESLRSSATLTTASLALHSNGGNLLPRIRRLFGIKPSSHPSKRLATLSSIIFAMSVGIVLLYVLGCAQPSSSQTSHESKPSSTQPTEADKALRARITSSLTDISSNKMSLRNTLDQLATTNAIIILVNWPVLQSAGISPETPVSVSLRQTPIDRVLLTILASVPPRDATLGYKLQDGAIIVSTLEDLQAGEPIETRVYDVRDILTQADPDVAFVSTNPNASFAPDTQPSSMKTDREARRNKIVHGLIESIEQAVAPYSWKDNGGAVGTIRELQGSLIVSQSQTNLKEVEDILNVLHKTHDFVINIEPRFFLVDEPTFQAIAVQYPLLKNSISPPGQNISPVILNDQQLSELLTRIAASHKNESMAAPRVTLFNGQTAKIAVENRQQFISGAHPQADRGSPKYDTATASGGTFMDVKAFAAADRNSAAMDINLELRTLLRLEEKPAEGFPPDQHITIQSPIYDIHKFNDRLSLRTHTTALWGGDIITASLINPLTTRSVSNEPRRLLVLIRPVIVQPKEISKNLNGPSTK